MKPSKIVCVGLNYKQHASELKMDLPKEPIIFLKPPTTLIKHREDIIYPVQSQRIDYEAELGIVIAQQCKDVAEQDVLKYIKGYCCVNDVTARDIQKLDGQWTRAKSFDTFCPVGDIINKLDLDPDNLKIEAYLNGELKQSSNTKDMIFTVAECISYISKVMTLLPGDLILTGTPEGIGPMQRGDEIKIVIEGLPELINSVK